MPLRKEDLVRAIEEAKKKSKKRNFLQSVELIAVLSGIDPKKHPEHRMNEVLALPHKPNKPVKICVFASGELARKAKEMGVEVVTREDLPKYADKRRAKKLAKNYDFFVAETPMMPLVARYMGPVLGPRGKMPTPVPPTADPMPILERLSRSVRLRIKDQPVVQCLIGTEDMPSDQLAENAMTVLSRLEEKFGEGLARIVRVYVKTTMGPTVRAA